MKSLSPFIFLVFLLAACSRTPQASIEAPAPAEYSSPTPHTAGVPTDDPIQAGIRFLFSKGSHSLEYTCDDCHETSSSGITGLIWLNEVTGQKESISTATELCTKCHPDQAVAGKTDRDKQPAHTDFGCIDCHNAHSTQADCTQSACHVDVRSTIFAQIEQPENHPTSGDSNTHMCEGSTCHDLAKQVAGKPIYHQPVHRDVPCYVCHDGTGMVIAQGTNGAWSTMGEVTQQTAASHTITRSVDCAKCHYSGNPWSLIESVSVTPTPIGIP